MKKFLLASFLWFFLFPLTALHAQREAIPADGTDVAWSPDGSQLAISGDFGVAFYDSNFQLVATIIHQRISYLDWSPDGKILAVGYYVDGVETLSLWDISNNRLIANLPKPAGGISDLHWSPNSQQLAIFNYENIEIYEIATQTLVFSLSPSSYFNTAQWSPDGTQLATTEGEGFHYPVLLRFWNAQTGTLELSIDLTATQDVITLPQVAWSLDGTQLALGTGPSPKGSVPLFDIGSQTVTRAFDLSYEGASFLGWSPDGLLFLATDLEAGGNYIYLWDAVTYELLWYHTLSGLGAYRTPAWKPDSSQIAVVNDPDNGPSFIQILDPLTGDIIIEPELPPSGRFIIERGSDD